MVDTLLEILTIRDWIMEEMNKSYKGVMGVE